MNLLEAMVASLATGRRMRVRGLSEWSYWRDDVFVDDSAKDIGGDKHSDIHVVVAEELSAEWEVEAGVGGAAVTVPNDAATLTRREAASLDRAATDSLLLAAGLERAEIVALRRKLRGDA